MTDTVNNKDSAPKSKLGLYGKVIQEAETSPQGDIGEFLREFTKMCKRIDANLHFGMLAEDHGLAKTSGHRDVQTFKDIPHVLTSIAPYPSIFLRAQLISTDECPYGDHIRISFIEDDGETEYKDTDLVFGTQCTFIVTQLGIDIYTELEKQRVLDERIKRTKQSDS